MQTHGLVRLMQDLIAFVFSVIRSTDLSFAGLRAHRLVWWWATIMQSRMTFLEASISVLLGHPLD